MRGRPGDRRLLPAAARGRTLHGFLAALKAVGRDRQQFQRALDGSQGIPLRAGHQTAELPDKRLHLFVTLVGLTLAPVGEGFTLVGLTLTLVGLTLTQVGEGFADDIVTVTPAGVAGRLRLRLGLLRSSRLRGLHPAGIFPPGVIRARVHDSDATRRSRSPYGR